jgi:hypothetical protein
MDTHHPPYSYFPYDKPYEIQVKFMDAVYDAIRNRKIALMSSPTGTVHRLRISLILHHRLDSRNSHSVELHNSETFLIAASNNAIKNL